MLILIIITSQTYNTYCKMIYCVSVIHESDLNIVSGERSDSRNDYSCLYVNRNEGWRMQAEEEPVTEEDLELIKERETNIRQLEVSTSCMTSANQNDHFFKAHQHSS